MKPESVMLIYMLIGVTYVVVMTEQDVQFQYRAMVQSRHNVEVTEKLA